MPRAVSAGLLCLGVASATAQPVELTRPPYPAALMERANDALRVRDISAARRLLQAAADQGVAAAATALGRTFDPNEQVRLGVLGMHADPEAASKWYQLGISLGDPAARPLLATLNARSNR